MIHETRGRLLSLSNYVSPAATLSIVKEDPDDDRVLECADAAPSGFIVTEDNDLLRLKRFGDARIVKTREFLEIALTKEKEQL